MKVVHLNNSDVIGGAARAASRINQSLVNYGIESTLIVGKKSGDSEQVCQVTNKKFVNRVSVRIKHALNKYQSKTYAIRPGTLFSTGSYGIVKSEISMINDSDIVHLHWINDNFYSISELRKLIKSGKHIVWTLHDMWAFTGGCHYSGECKKYESHCFHCEEIKSKIDKDISYKVFEKKYKTFNSYNMTVVTCSNWLAECAKSSLVFRKNRIETIPNPIETEIFKPFDRTFSRDVLSLKNNKFYILFGAMNSTTDKRKGYNYLIDALKEMSKFSEIDQEGICILCFGAKSGPQNIDIPYPIEYLGKIYDDHKLSLIYNSADVFVAPSLQDNLPNTVMESLSCGTPVVAFNIGGMSDMIQHKKSGYLARYIDSSDLANGIKEVYMQGKSNYTKYCREKVINNYTYEVVAKKYINLYNSIIE